MTPVPLTEQELSDLVNAIEGCAFEDDPANPSPLGRIVNSHRYLQARLVSAQAEDAEFRKNAAGQLLAALDRAHAAEAGLVSAQEALRLSPCGRELVGAPACGTDALADAQLGVCSRCEVLAVSTSTPHKPTDVETWPAVCIAGHVVCECAAIGREEPALGCIMARAKVWDAAAENIDFQQAVEETWAHVFQRDWKNDPAAGSAEPPVEPELDERAEEGDAS